ncbi:MAG: DNA primase, partial [Opitutaceae bacterium]
PPPPPPPPPAAAAVPSADPLTAERDLLALCLHHEEIGPAVGHALQPGWVDTGHTAGRLLNRFLGEFEQGSWPGRDHLDSLLEDDAERALVASLRFEPPQVDDPARVAQAGLARLRSRALEPRLRQIELALANPGAEREAESLSLLQERSALQRQLRQPVILAPPA